MYVCAEERHLSIRIVIQLVTFSDEVTRLI